MSARPDSKIAREQLANTKKNANKANGRDKKTDRTMSSWADVSDEVEPTPQSGGGGGGGLATGASSGPPRERPRLQVR